MPAFQHVETARANGGALPLQGGLRLRGRIWIGLAVTLVAGIVLSMSQPFLPGRAVRAMEGIAAASLMKVTGPVNILLIANNARNSTGPLSMGTAGGQADVLLLAHVDAGQHKVTFVSIPRDTLIGMPRWNVSIPKIKTAFTLGLGESPELGPQYELQVVEKLTGLPISHYIVTDFRGFADAVDAVGGIQVDIPDRIYDPVFSGADFRPGLQRLNGTQALAYVRVRQNQAGNLHRVDDFQRQQAEIHVLELLKQKVLDSAGNPGRVERLLQVWRKDVATDMSRSELAGLALAASGASTQTITLGSVADSMDLASTPLAGVNRQSHLTGAYYDVLDPKQIDTALKPLGSTGSDTRLPPIPSPAEVPVTVIGSQAVLEQLRKHGFPVTYGGLSGDPVRISVLYPPGHIAWGFAVARSLGAGNEWVAPSRRVAASVEVICPN